MLNSHYTTIISSIPEARYPENVKAALAFQAAANTLEASIADETRPDLNDARTPADVAKLHKAAVAFDLGRESRKQHATELSRIAANRTEDVWRATVPAFERYFAEQFDHAAAALYAALKTVDGDPAELASNPWNPEGEAIRETLATLGRLSAIRDEYAYKDGMPDVTLTSSAYEQSSRVAYFESAVIETRFRELLHHRKPNRWLLLAQTEGARIQWQTVEQQRTQPVAQAITNRDKALAAEMAQRSQYAYME